MIRLRSLKDDTFSAIIISRLLAISIPLFIVTVAHVMNTFGMSVYDPLLSPVIGLALVTTGAFFAVIGMKVGLAIPFIFIVILWALALYFYWNYELGILCIPLRVLPGFYSVF